jgi:conjugal transfer mating pair stabilization protein TraG
MRIMRLAKARLMFLVIVFVIVGATQKQPVPPKIDPAAYATLLGTIAKGESNGNYNAYYGHAANESSRFTDMSVGEVMKWQEEYVRKGSVSSAVGKYQIIRSTLAGLVNQMQLDLRIRFDKALQDRLAITLLERRGAHAFVQKKLTREEFAANLSKEWAALPKATGTNPSESHYAGDGINKSRVSVDEVYGALAILQANTSTPSRTRR